MDYLASAEEAKGPQASRSGAAQAVDVAPVWRALAPTAAQPASTLRRSQPVGRRGRLRLYSLIVIPAGRLLSR
jgi:hypothetical protein